MDLIDRLQRRLREAVARRLSEGGTPAFTIADVYQQLVPYRAVRGDLGILELAEYEHALLRLLAGERGHLRLEQPQAQRELRKELESPNPILGVYRDYADVGVVLLPELWTPPLPAQTPTPSPAIPVPDPHPVPVPPEHAAPAPAAACRSCRASLPVADDLRFCPFCGVNQREIDCAECGRALKPDWSFCIRCGTPHPERRNLS